MCTDYQYYYCFPFDQLISHVISVPNHIVEKTYKYYFRKKVRNGYTFHLIYNKKHLANSFFYICRLRKSAWNKYFIACAPIFPKIIKKKLQAENFIGRKIEHIWANMFSVKNFKWKYFIEFWYQDLKWKLGKIFPYYFYKLISLRPAWHRAFKKFFLSKWINIRVYLYVYIFLITFNL